MLTYLLLGLWTYVVLCCARSDGFANAKWSGIVGGFLLALWLWPIAPIICYVVDRYERKEKG